MSSQEVITPADAERAISERKALGIEKRVEERHEMRMAWYRRYASRQLLCIAVAILAFVGVTIVSHYFDWWTAVTAAVFAGGALTIMNLFNVGAQPPEER